MESSLRDFYLPLIFIAIVIGYQISIYFLYQYLKYRKEKIKLHNLLLGYSLIFGFMLTAFTIRIINLYFLRTNYPSVFDILTRITYIFLYSGIMLYCLIISSKAFDKIIKTHLIKLLAFLLLIPLCTVFFLKIETLIFSLIAGLTLSIYYGFLLFFQTRLIKLTTGDIQKRLKLILNGIILCFISHFIGGYTPSYVLLGNFSDFLQIISVPIFILGLLIFFLGVYKFPAFLEFDWRENLISLFIVNKTNYRILYSFNFKHNTVINREREDETNITGDTELLFSRGIIGIDNIISLVSESKNKGLEQIKHGDYLILLNYGDEPFVFLTFCLLVKKEMKSLNFLIKKTKEEFLKLYSPILYNINQLEESETKIFSSFDKILDKMII